MVAEAPEKLAVKVVELPALIVVLAAVNVEMVAGGTVVVVVVGEVVVVVPAGTVVWGAIVLVVVPGGFEVGTTDVVPAGETVDTTGASDVAVMPAFCEGKLIDELPLGHLDPTCRTIFRFDLLIHDLIAV